MAALVSPQIKDVAAKRTKLRAIVLSAGVPIYQNAVDFHPLRKFNQEFGIAVEVVHLRRLVLGEGSHCLHVGPVGDGREPCLPVKVLAQQLDA